MKGILAVNLLTKKKKEVFGINHHQSIGQYLMMMNVMNTKKQVDADVQKCYTAAQQFMNDLQTSQQQFQTDYLNGMLSQASFAFCNQLLNVFWKT